MRGLISAVVVAVAVVLQLAVADRIAFPGGAGPNLVLLTVAALALATGPMAGPLIGFCAGLALDVAPPAGHLVGTDALVFCLVGYACGLFATGSGADGVPEPEHSALFEIGITAAGAAVGEAMAAGLGVMLSDPRVTWAAVKHVLPVAVGYDLLLSPFVLFAAAAMLRVAGAVTPRAAGLNGVSVSAAHRRAAWANTAPGATRQLGSTTPKLRLSGQSGGGLGLGGAHGGPRRGQAAGLDGGAKLRFGGRRGEGALGGSRLAGSRLGGSASSGQARSPFSATKLSTSRLGASLLGGSVFGRSGSHLGPSSSLTGPSKTKTHLGSGPHQPHFGKASTLSRLAASLRRPQRSKSPGKRWLRGTSPGRGRSWLTSTRTSTTRRSPGRGWLRGSSSLGRATSSTSWRAGKSARNRSRIRIGNTRKLSRARSLGRTRKLGGISRIGGRRGGPARLRMRSVKPGRSWRRPGGYR